ncbi:MAG: hypothetical protein NT091_04170 [Candidatus Falkowbacteria bacterium]|nr:hypothetical protein [Candidatus Falkowbacteria bacterium]
MDRISFNEIEVNKLSTIDEVGFVFSWSGRIFRAINKKSEDAVRDMFDSGLVAKLIENKFISNTWISEYSLDNVNLILEHEKITHVTYPQEWSFSMLQDAAILVSELNQFLAKYEYQLKDCHGYNILFDKISPVFVDFGSIIKIPNKYNRFLCLGEFMSFYYYPLKIWSRGSFYLANAIINHSSIKVMSYQDGAILTNRFLFRIKGIVEFYKKLRKKLKINKIDWMLFSKIDYKSLINQIKKPKYTTEWKNYHDEFFTKEGSVIYGKDRFNRILELIQSFPDIKSILEVGGNQGIVSQLISEKTEIKDIVCTDYDEQAVDLMYLRLKKILNKNITPVIINFIYPYVNNFELSPTVRFKSDAVLALALTHHLLITQKIDIDYLMNVISDYTNKYAFIEFMPLGLWDGNTALVV